MTDNEMRDRIADAVPRHYAAPEAAEIAEALLSVVRKAQAGAWDQGYAYAEADAYEEPYSDRPERATWQLRRNPYRAEASA